MEAFNIVLQAVLILYLILYILGSKKTFTMPVHVKPILKFTFYFAITTFCIVQDDWRLRLLMFVYITGDLVVANIKARKGKE